MQSEPKSIKYLLRCNEYQEFVGWCNDDYEYVSEIIFYHTFRYFFIEKYSNFKL